MPNLENDTNIKESVLEGKILNSRILTDNQIYLYAIYTLYYCDEYLINRVNEKYKQCLILLRFYYDNFDVLKISNKKLLILIYKKIIRITAETLVFIRENYSDKVYYFIKNNINQYVEIMDNNIFDFSELIEILSWKISDEIKIKLLDFTNKKISIIDKNYTPDVCKNILINNFINSDLNNLILSYEQWDKSVQEIIFDYAVSNISPIINNQWDMSKILAKRLLSTESIDQTKKIELFITMLPNLNKAEIKESLEFLNLSEYLKIFKQRSRPRFLIDLNSQKLLSAFKENDLILDYKKDPNDEQYYKIERNKMNKSIPVKLL